MQGEAPRRRERVVDGALSPDADAEAELDRQTSGLRSRHSLEVVGHEALYRERRPRDRDSVELRGQNVSDSDD